MIIHGEQVSSRYPAPESLGGISGERRKQKQEERNRRTTKKDPTESKKTIGVITDKSTETIETLYSILRERPYGVLVGDICEKLGISPSRLDGLLTRLENDKDEPVGEDGESGVFLLRLRDLELKKKLPQ